MRRIWHTLSCATLLVLLAVRPASAGPIEFGSSGTYFDIVNAGGHITWTEAKAAAEALVFNGVSGHLADPKTAALDAFLIQTFDVFDPASPNNSFPYGGGVLGPWIGLHSTGDPTDLNDYEWSDGSPFDPLGYSGWLPDQPSGTEDVTTAVAFEPGNGVNPDFDNTVLPNIPQEWGSTSMAISVGDTYGGALRARTGFENLTGATTDVEFYVAVAPLTDGTKVTLAVGKAISPLFYGDPATPVAYRVHLVNEGGILKLQVLYPTEAGVQTDTWSGIVDLYTVYDLHIEYNIAFNRFVVTVNGETVTNFTLDSASVRSIGTLVLGSSGSTTARNLFYLMDQIVESPIPTSGQVDYLSMLNGGSGWNNEACQGNCPGPVSFIVQYDTVQAIPEPATLVLIGPAVVGLLGRRFHKRAARRPH